MAITAELLGVFHSDSQGHDASVHIHELHCQGTVRWKYTQLWQLRDSFAFYNRKSAGRQLIGWCLMWPKVVPKAGFLLSAASLSLVCGVYPHGPGIVSALLGRDKVGQIDQQELFPLDILFRKPNPGNSTSHGSPDFPGSLGRESGKLSISAAYVCMCPCLCAHTCTWRYRREAWPRTIGDILGMSDEMGEAETATLGRALQQKVEFLWKAIVP